MKGKDNNHQSVGVTNLEYWEKDFNDLPFYTIIEKLLDTPNEMSGAIIRSVLKDERQSNAIILLANRFKKYHDERHMEMLKWKLASLAAIGGRARIEALFGAIRLIAPDMYRAVMGMQRQKEKEQIYRGGPDFREAKEERQED